MAVADLLVFWVLPFVLVFVLVFAILNRTKIFGSDRQQIDALIAVVMAAIFVITPGPHVEYAVSMIPWLAVALIVILIFFLIYGFFVGEMKEVPSWLKWGGLIVALAIVFGLVVTLTPIESFLGGYLSGNSDWMISLLILGIAIGAVYWAVQPGKS